MGYEKKTCIKSKVLHQYKDDRPNLLSNSLHQRLMTIRLREEIVERNRGGISGGFGLVVKQCPKINIWEI